MEGKIRDKYMEYFFAGWDRKQVKKRSTVLIIS